MRPGNSREAAKARKAHRSAHGLEPVRNEPPSFAHELRRKLFHVLLGVILIGLFWAGMIDDISLSVLFLAGVVISVIYAFHPVHLIGYFLRRFDRIESVPGRGALTFVAGFTIAAALFPKGVALAAMAVLTVGDAAAALIGRFGKIPYPWCRDKTFEGGLAFLFFGFVSAVPFLAVPGCYLAALAGAIVEGIPRPRGAFFRLLLDDNILIPLAVGTALSFLA